MSEKNDWKPIESAPQTGRTLLLGYWNSRGNWRTVRGQWMSAAYIAEFWEEPDDVEEGWFETSAESDDLPNCWPVTPSHWQPLPAAPCQTCNGHGMVGGLTPHSGYDSEPCPDCRTPPASAQDDAKDERQAQPIKLVHLAVAEDGGVRFITGRKLPDGIESCELYAMPDYGRAPAELFHAPAAGDARSPVLNIEAAAKAMAECMDYPWAHMPEQGRAAMREHAQTVIRAASQQQEG